MTRSIPAGDIRPFGDRALLIGVADGSAGRSVAASLEHVLGEMDVELVCGQSTICVVARAAGPDRASLRAAVADALRDAATRAPAVDAGSGGRIHTVPCSFEGPDLAEVSALAGASVEQVVTWLTEGPLRVGVVGFSPGFAYLEGLPAALQRVPRRPRPRPAVPAGSVALANGHAAIYPTASPGGWQLVGRTGFPLFNPDGPPYATLAPGDRVQFVSAGADAITQPAPLSAPVWSPPAGARPVFEVLAPGMRAVVQDAGRRGAAASGVPAAGAADPMSMTLANLLTGSAADAAALEVTGGGTRLRGLGPCHVAAVGAAPTVRIDGSDQAPGQLMPLAAGQTLEIGALRRGCRCYVAVAGGLLGPEMFGSRSSDELCGLGRGPLAPGDRLFAGSWGPPLGDHLAPGTATELAGEGPVELRVVAGPHSDRFDPGVLDRLARADFRVADDSNRVGLRLRSSRPAAWGAAGGELDSQPMVTGAVQLSPGGEPVVLLPDHATLGGYPVPAVVIAADLGHLGQCAPGDVVRLIPVGLEEADEAMRAQGRALAGAVVGHYPLATG